MSYKIILPDLKALKELYFYVVRTNVKEVNLSVLQIKLINNNIVSRLKGENCQMCNFLSVSTNVLFYHIQNSFFVSPNARKTGILTQRTSNLTISVECY